MTSIYHTLKDLKNLSREELNNILLDCSGYKSWTDKKKLANHVYKYKNNIVNILMYFLNCVLIFFKF